MSKLLYLVIPFMLINFSFAQKAYQVEQHFSIKSAGGWDYLMADPTSDRLYVSHGNQVNILNKSTGDSIGIIENTPGVHGIAIIKKLNKGYTSNGRGNNVSVFDLNTLKTTGQIATGENPDAIMYDPFSGKIITCNGRSKDLTIIDPIEAKPIATIPVGGKPETAVSDNKGKLYVNVEDKNEIAVIDLKSMTMIDHWSLLPAEEPTGLAIDTKLGLLFAGCDKKLVIIQTETGKVDKMIEIGEGCDGVAYDPALKTVFTSNGSGTMSIVKANTKGEFSLSQTLNTKKGARTICNDPSTHLVYSPTAEFESQEPNDRNRPKMIAGSFQILVIK